jgi:molybdopterin/thiamine biosynthesis adenylyltransferase
MHVRLRSHILPAIAEDLHFASEAFRREEGGYLVGRFDGSAVEVVRHSLDRDAERTPGSIRLREAHMDYVTDGLRQGGDPSLYLVGTWHAHPPGFGPQFSGVDEEYLFIEHTAVRADGLVSARLPQIHLVVSWGNPRDYRLYGMKVEVPGLAVESAPAVPRHLQFLGDALARGCGAGLLLHGTEDRTVPYSGPAVAEAVRDDSLVGLFWRFPYPAISEEVEMIYLANFVYHVRKTIQALKRRVRSARAGFRYYRITLPDGQPAVTPLRLQFALAEGWPRTVHMACPVTSEVSVSLSNPDARDEPFLDLGADPDATVGDVGHALQRLRGFQAPPIISTLRPLAEAPLWRERGVDMDEVGEVVLPDDVKIPGLVEADQPGRVVLYWRSPELHPDMVYKLRTQRLRDIGYDLPRLRGSSVVLVGLGLLGSELASLLTATGLGELHLVDHGAVDFTNIHRQRLYGCRDVYQPKVAVAASRMAGAGIKVTGHRLTVPTLAGEPGQTLDALTAVDALVARAQLVVGALDSFSGRAVLQALCLHRRVPFLSVALGMADLTGLAQADLSLSLPDRPGCYACDRRLLPRQDSALCTIAPLEFAPIAAGLGLRLAMDVLHGRAQNALRMQVSEDADTHVRVTVQQIGSAVAECEVCGSNGLVGRTEATLFQRIRRWLLPEGATC